jgi:hypothetical protein
MSALFGEVEPQQDEEKPTMFSSNVISSVKVMLLTGVLASSILVSSVVAQSVAPASKLAATPAHSRYQPNHFAGRAGKYYALIWGIDSLSVKTVESGEIIRFSYRVLDADKANPLNDKKVEPALNDPQAGVSLVVPALEQVGLLRQTGTPKAGMSYWMAFSNSGMHVKRGDHVDVVIGKFRANGLVVE